MKVRISLLLVASRRRYNGEFAPGLLLAIIESPSKRALLVRS
jgi:hypothetical protein